MDRGEVVEWYVNDPRGLEQGFTLAGPPDESEPRGEEAPAILVLALSGSLSPVVSTDGQAVDFVTAGGAVVLHYAELKLADAGGRELPAWMEGFAAGGGRGIRIVFDDAEAAYPVTVDPLLTDPAWTAEGDQAGARFGLSVSTAGDVNGDGFADVIVGAPGYDNGEEDEGRAYVYHGSAAGLSDTAAWTAESDQAEAGFGGSVSTAGDVDDDGFDDVIVGAAGYDPAGRAYVYHGSTSGLNTGYDWMAEGGQAGESFGSSVSTAGDVNGDGYADVIVGAPLYDNIDFYEGRIFVYYGSEDGLSTTANVNRRVGGQVSFGYSVSTAGDVNGDGYDDFIVGTSPSDPLVNPFAVVYYGSALGPGPNPNWSASADEGFGRSVSTAGDVNGDGYADVIIGYIGLTNGQYFEGGAFIYHGSTSGLSDFTSSRVESNQASAEMGNSVSTAGDVNGDGYADVIVGARKYDNGESNEGRAYVYYGSDSGLISNPPAWTAESDQASAEFGFSVSTAGDVNGDGYAGVIVGARRYDNGEDDEGAAFLYQGSPDIAPAGWVPADTPLLLGKTDGDALHLSWGFSCLPSDLDYEVYEGELGDFTSHAPRFCGTAGETEVDLNPEVEQAYYLVVPASANAEGSYGKSSDGTERPPGVPACLGQVIGECD
jgi:hypothetical protein